MLRTKREQALSEDPRPDRANTPAVIRLAACLFAAGAVGFSVWHMFAYRLPFSFRDMIDIERFIEAESQRGWSISGFFAIVQNEHRPVFPLFLWLADHAWFASDGVLVIAVDAALLGVTSLLLAGWMRSATQPGFRRIALMTAVPVVIFWPAQGENLVRAAQANSVFALAALVMAVEALRVSEAACADAAGRRRCLAWLAVTSLLLFVSTYSLAYGLVGWPLFLAFLMLRRRPWWMIAVLAATGLASVALYAALWVEFPRLASVAPAIPWPLSLAAYFFGLLGGPLHKLIEWPFLRTPTAWRGVAGAAVFVLVICAAFRVLFRTRADDRSQRSQADAALVLTALLGLGCAFLIALGRHRLGMDQSLAPRYTIIACLVWLGAAGYWIPRLRTSRSVAIAGQAATALFACAMIPSYFGHAAASQEQATRVRVAAMTELAGITHPDLKLRLHDDADSRAWLFESLRRRGHPLFAAPWQAWVGRRAADVLGEPIAGRCAGHVDVTSRLGDDIVQMSGWAWDTVAGAPPPIVAVVDGSGVIRGLGASGTFRLALFALTGRPKMLNAGWLATARTPAERIDVVGVLEDGRSCRLTPRLSLARR